MMADLYRNTLYIKPQNMWIVKHNKYNNNNKKNKKSRLLNMIS